LTDPGPSAVDELKAAVQEAAHVGVPVPQETEATVERQAERDSPVGGQRRRITVAVVLGIPVVLARYFREGIASVVSVGPWAVWIVEGRLALSVVVTANAVRFVWGR